MRIPSLRRGDLRAEENLRFLEGRVAHEDTHRRMRQTVGNSKRSYLQKISIFLLIFFLIQGLEHLVSDSDMDIVRTNSVLTIPIK